MNHISDFTTGHYTDLLKLAKAAYRFILYDEINASDKTILWRHDCDVSLNRALRLAQIEREQEVRATYFLNPHCRFYNLLEKTQTDLVEEIVAQGHSLGLHFDAAFHGLVSEEELDTLVRREAEWLCDWFGKEVTAFSFHNPTDFLLKCNRDKYGGLTNCYSRHFRVEVGYCSDSNGYWRFRRLHDVLESAEDMHLQVLTHPEWWQDEPLHARDRIARSVYGRAEAVLDFYDEELAINARQNNAGFAEQLRFMAQVDRPLYRLCAYLWSSRRFSTLFTELWRVHELQTRRLVEEWPRTGSIVRLNAEAVSDRQDANKEGWRLLTDVAGETWERISGGSQAEQRIWSRMRDRVLHGIEGDSLATLEEGCVYLCRVIANVARWAEDKRKRGDVR